MAMTGPELRDWLHEELDAACALIRQAKEDNDEASALVHRGEMHAIVRVLRHAVDGEDMGALFDLVALIVGEADFHISELGDLEDEGAAPWLRPATPADVDTIAAWHPLPAAEVRGWWEDPEMVPWVMLDADNAMVGYGEIWLDPAEDEVEVARLIIDPQLRGRGLGKRMTQLLTAKALETGLATTMLRVMPDNDIAINCYLRCGFELLGPEEAAIWNEGQRLEWVWMVYRGARSGENT
jgi:RimJ/RimL family protein N-acetyltransferase